MAEDRIQKIGNYKLVKRKNYWTRIYKNNYIYLDSIETYQCTLWIHNQWCIIVENMVIPFHINKTPNFFARGIIRWAMEQNGYQRMRDYANACKKSQEFEQN